MADCKGCYVLLLLTTILCLYTVSAQILTPVYFNVAYGKRISATATCGEGIPEPERGERYCKLTGNTGDVFRPAEADIIHGQYCDQCNIYDPDKKHPIDYATDGTEKWWQSPPISRGSMYNEVNITIDLGQLYHVAYLIIKSANSPRPGQWILERSTDYGKTYSAWQYFAETASDCSASFGADSLKKIRNDDDVICTDEYSNIVPLEDGEIVVSLVNGRPSANNYFYSEVLQNWTKATNIRLRLIRTNTLLGHLMAVAREDPTVTRRYFYSIKDISIGGRCFCNGHASTCDTLDNAGRLQCTCEHNTCGTACDICCPGFVQKIWKPASKESSNECEPCNCFGHATECYYDNLVAAERRSIDIYGEFEGGGVCQNCQHNTQGINCNKCTGGYYRPEGRDVSSHNVCEKCHCNPLFSTGNCADITGVCECRPEYAGPKCSQCNQGYYGYPSCRPCDCNIIGTQGKICQDSGGQCPCKPSYTGRNCDRCALGYFNFPSCESCGCDGIGSRDTICEPGTGQCPCHDVYRGRTCSQCKDGYYGYPACRDCNCNAVGTTDVICDKDVGTCLCEDNFELPRCDRCADGYYNYPACQACNCGSGTTTNFCYDDGQCMCSPNFSGTRCERCAAGYYRFPDCVSCECSFSGAFSISCDQSSGKCDCWPNFQGRMCEQCAESFYNYPTCEECNCHPGGAIDVPGQPPGGCGPATGGACLCKENVQGRTCNECKATFWNLQISNPRGCELCECNPDGTIAGNEICNIITGQCHCKVLVTNTQCTECVDGTYQLDGGNAFGCRDCLCDVGGAIHLVCDKETGQCICRPRVTGPNCNKPMLVHYFPTLYQHMFEIESGTTPDGGDLRIGYDDSEFPNFSYLGYAVMSNIQAVVHVPITVDRSSIYRIILRYVNPGDTTVHGKITLIPSGSDSKQESGIQFYNGNDPQLVTVDGGSNMKHFVLDPGHWIARIEAPEGILLDYLVLLPLAYYEASILQVRVNEPCVAGASQELCNYYVFPKIDNIPTVRGVDGYHDNNGEFDPIPVYDDRDLLDDLGVPDLALLDVSQPSLYFLITIEDQVQYIIIVEYYGGGPGKQQATFDLWGLGDVSRGTLNLYDCSYLCRSVVVDESTQPMVFDMDDTELTGQILPIGSPFPLGISQIIAIPILHWSEDLITPALKCVKTATGECAPSSYPYPPGSIHIETGADKHHPPEIQDPSTSLKYLSNAEGYTTLAIDPGVQPLDGSWVFIVHYYQPHPTAVDVNFGIPGEYGGIGTFTGHYCPHVSGCRAVVTRSDGSPNFDLTGQGQGITFSLPPQSKGEIWIDYILAIPKSSYTPSILIEEPQDRAGDFINECGQQNFYLNPMEVSKFCHKSVFSLSVDYNNGAKPCNCDLQGSTELQCKAFGGQCSCKANIIGRDCTRCRIGYYNFPYCRRCECAAYLPCDMVTGACICPAGATGERCDQCADRHVLTLDRCQPCDECVHQLLDAMDDLSDQIEGATADITKISVGQSAIKRLNRQPELVLMQVNNLALSTNISAINATFDHVTTLADEVETKSIGTLGTADRTSQEAEVTKVRAEDLEGKLNSTRDAIKDAISAHYNSTESSSNLTADAISNLVEQAQIIVGEIDERNFGTIEEMAETELGLAKELHEQALMLHNASTFILERAQNVSMNVNDFLDKLSDLVNRSAVANNMSDAANEIMMRNTPPSFEGVLTLVEGNFTAGRNETDKASALLDEAQKLLDAANEKLEGSQLNASKLEAAIALLETHISTLQMQGEELTPLVDMAKNYAENLTKQAEYLDSLLRDTRELAANAVKAANAYKDIADAINAAESAAKAARNSSSSAEQKAGSFGDRPAQSLKQSKRLRRKAIKALDGIKDLDATLGDVKDSIDKVKADLDDADSRVTDIRNGIDEIPKNSSKCTITVCDEGAPDECKPGFTGEECDSALLSQQAQQAVDTAMEADSSAQRAQDIADWVNARLPNLEEKAAILSDDVREANNSMVAADDAINRSRSHIDSIRDLDMSLMAKHNNLTNLTATMDDNLKELREKINQARTSAAWVNVAMKLGNDSYLQLRRPNNYEVPSTRNSIELYFNTRMDDALLYFAGGPLKTDNYMAIEIKEGKPVLRYNLGGEDGEAVVEADVSDGKWRKVVIERNANNGRVIIFSEGRKTSGGASLDSGSTLSFSPEAKFYLGGVPPEVQLPNSITASSFEGCIDDLVYDSESVGLWNFENGEGIDECCLRNVTELCTPPKGDWYFDGSGYAIMNSQGTPGSSALASVLSLYFKTCSQNGLLYFSESQMKVDYLSLELRSGKLFYHWDVGGGPGSVESDNLYNDNEWTRVQITISKNQGKLLVFRRSVQVESKSGMSPGGTDALEYGQRTFYGGLTSIADEDYPDITRHGFRGCIRDIKFGSATIDLTDNIGTIGTSPKCVPTYITKVAFGGSGGYMSWTPVDIDKSKKIVFQFRTEQPEGLILYMANELRNNYLAVAIVGGAVHVVADSGNDRIEVRSVNSNYNDGQPHTVTIAKNVKTLTLTVDGTQDNPDISTAQFRKKSLRTDYLLYVGGLPDGANVKAGILPTTEPFIGYIIDLSFDEQLLGMISNVREQRDAFTNTCLMSATEAPVTNTTNPTTLSVEIVTTTPMPRDLCALPDNFSKTKIDPADEDAFKFGITSNSRFEYPTLTKEFINNGKISFDIRTCAVSGVLFYVSDEDQREREFAFLKDGKIVYGFDYGAGPVFMTSNIKINDGEWHNVELNRVMKTGFVEVDDVEVARGRLYTESIYLRTTTPLYVGGIPNDYILKNVGEGSNGSLVGCIKNLTLNDRMLPLPDADKQYDVEPCSGIKKTTTPSPVEIVTMTPMPKDLCALPENSSEAEIDPADEGAFQFGITSNSRFEYPVLPQEFRRSGKISLDIRTSAVNGLLFYAADTRQIDRVFAFLKEGNILFGFDYGSGPVLITSDIKINDGEWHNVELNRVMKTGIIEVDDVEVAKQELLGDSIFLSTTTPLYVGGIPSDYTPKGVEEGSRGGLLGCIKNLALNDQIQPMPNADKQFDVEPCSGIKEPGVFFGPERGHIIIAPTYNVGTNLEARMSLKPRSSTGIIFSVTDTPRGDFMSLEMVDGVLYLRSDNGVGEIEATYTPPEGAYFMCDGNWHDIIVIKKGHTLQIILDGDEGEIATGTDRAQAVNTNHPLYLGGLPAGEEHRGIRTDKDYIGCIRDVMFRFDLIDFKTVDSVVGNVDLQACPTH